MANCSASVAFRYRFRYDHRWLHAWRRAARTGHDDVLLALNVSTLRGATLVVHAFAYDLARPDWNVVREGRLLLTLFQQIVFSGWMPWAIYLLFYLVLAWKLGVFRRKKQKGL